MKETATDFPNNVVRSEELEPGENGSQDDTIYSLRSSRYFVESGVAICRAPPMTSSYHSLQLLGTILTEAGIENTNRRLIEAWLVSGISLWCPCSHYVGGRLIRSYKVIT